MHFRLRRVLTMVLRSHRFLSDTQIPTRINGDGASTHTISEAEKISRRAQLRALLRVARYKPTLAVAIVVGGVFAALLEGVGLGFILPIVEIVQAEDPVAEAEGVMLAFVTLYQLLGIPFTPGRYSYRT